jgi:hypothetical protein
LKKRLRASWSMSKWKLNELVWNIFWKVLF